MLGIVLTRLVIPGVGGFGQLLGEVLRKTNVDADHRRSGMVRRFVLLDAILNLSSKPVSACQPRRRAAAEENHHNTAESNQSEVKCGVIFKAVGTALHKLDGNISIRSRKALHHVERLRLSVDCRRRKIDLLRDIDGNVMLDGGCDTGRSFPFLVCRVDARDLFSLRRVAGVAWLLLSHWDSRNNVSTDLLTIQLGPQCGFDVLDELFGLKVQLPHFLGCLLERIADEVLMNKAIPQIAEFEECIERRLQFAILRSGLDAFADIFTKERKECPSLLLLPVEVCVVLAFDYLRSHHRHYGGVGSRFSRNVFDQSFGDLMLQVAGGRQH